MIETLQQWSDRFVDNSVQLCAEPVANHVASLTAWETEAIKNSVEIRQNTYSTGRYCAKSALNQLGFTPEQYPNGLLRQSDGSVNWPLGSIGSISHTNDWAVAAAVKSGGKYESIGVDLEQIDRVEERVLRLIATDEEQSFLKSVPELRWGRVGLFSIKESLYKCLRPVFGEFINFKDVQLSGLDALNVDTGNSDAGSDNVLFYQPTIELLEPKLAACCGAKHVEARIAILQTHVLSFVSYSQ